MGRKNDVSATKKAEILAIAKCSSFSQRKIAKQAMVSVSTVNRIIKNDTDENALSKAGRLNCRGKRVTTPRGDRKINEIVNGSRWKSNKTILKLVRESGVEISEATLRRRIKELGFQTCRPAKKPRLTPSMEKKRLEWAKQHQHWTTEDWEKAIRHFLNFN